MVLFHVLEADVDVSMNVGSVTETTTAVITVTNNQRTAAASVSIYHHFMRLFLRPQISIGCRQFLKWGPECGGTEFPGTEKLCETVPAPTVTNSCRNAVVRSLMPRESKLYLLYHVHNS